MTEKQKKVLRSGKTLSNPFYKKLTTPITIRVSNDVLDYFKSTAKMSKTETLERLINSSLFDAMEKKLPERMSGKRKK
jgi:uncharacterized protein (DUF4415 family)